MHEWVTRIGYTVAQYFVERAANMGSALEIAGVGMLGIFIVIGVVILVVALLNKLFSE